MNDVELDTSWMDDAECAGMGPEKFWPNQWDLKAIAVAKATCAACGVREECLAYCIDSGLASVDGIWGGLTRAERRAGRVVSIRWAQTGRTRHTHGTRTAYDAGCRCAPCRSANARYMRQYRDESA